MLRNSKGVDTYAAHDLTTGGEISHDRQFDAESAAGFAAVMKLEEIDLILYYCVRRSLGKNIESSFGGCCPILSWRSE